MRKKAALLFMTFAVALSVSACGTSNTAVNGNASDNTAKPADTASASTAKSDKKRTIAVVPKALDNAVFLDSKDGAETAGKQLGVDVIWTGPTKSDAAEQVSVVEGLIQKKVDGILISVIDPNALKDVINKAADVGIKVATFDSDSPDSKRLFYAGTENYNLGKQMGEAFAKLVDGKQNIKLATLTGVPGSFNLEQRIKGFKEGAAKANINYLPVQACDDDVNKAVTVLEQYTQANSDLNAWFVAGAWPFLTPTETLPNMKKFAQNGGTVVSVDSFYPMLQYVKDGTVKVEIGQDFVKMGELGVKNLVDAINGQQVKSFVDTGTVYVDHTNVDDVLKTTKPWK